jgi:hypothetical protein
MQPPKYIQKSQENGIANWNNFFVRKWPIFETEMRHFGWWIFVDPTVLLISNIFLTSFKVKAQQPTLTHLWQISWKFSIEIECFRRHRDYVCLLEKCSFFFFCRNLMAAAPLGHDYSLRMPLRWMAIQQTDYYCKSLFVYKSQFGP